jgi:hypothetical protein
MRTTALACQDQVLACSEDYANALEIAPQSKDVSVFEEPK